MSELFPVLAWVVLAVAVGLGLAWRSARSENARQVVELEASKSREQALEAALARESSARKRQAEELAGLRKRSEKSRKRQSKPAAQPLGTASRIQALEGRIARLEEERDHVRSEREALAGEVARLRSARPAPPRVEAAPPAPVADTSESESARAEITALRERLEEGAARAAKLEAELAEARKSDAAARRRLEKQELLYVALRGELEAKKDRLRTQEEQLQRLQALKVAIADEPPVAGEPG